MRGVGSSGHNQQDAAPAFFFGLVDLVKGLFYSPWQAAPPRPLSESYY
jgi:hypothetical protein